MRDVSGPVPQVRHRTSLQCVLGASGKNKALFCSKLTWPGIAAAYPQVLKSVSKCPTHALSLVLKARTAYKGRSCGWCLRTPIFTPIGVTFTFLFFPTLLHLCEVQLQMHRCACACTDILSEHGLEGQACSSTLEWIFGRSIMSRSCCLEGLQMLRHNTQYVNGSNCTAAAACMVHGCSMMQLVLPEKSQRHVSSPC